MGELYKFVKSAWKEEKALGRDGVKQPKHPEEQGSGQRQDRVVEDEKRPVTAEFQL